jgi:branched-chain amino acid transport system permease protein
VSEILGIPLPPWALVEAQAFNGLQQGMLLALISAGLTIIYGALGVLNLAHGALYTIGAYAGYMTYNATGSFVLAIIAGAAVTMVAGLIMERVVMKHYYHRPHEDQILVTFGVGIILVEGIRALFGGVSQPVPTPSWGMGSSNLGFLTFPFPMYKIETIAISAAILLIFYLILYRTKLGLIVRAGIEDSGMVNMLGINVFRIFLLVFGLGAMAAGMAGIINSPITAPTPDVGGKYLVFSFVVIVIGGVGSFPGAVVGGIIAGEIMTLTSLVNPAYSEVMLFAVMAIILMVRPQGLFGQKGRM